MKVLQISCGFSYSNVYKNLFAELDKRNVNIEVYVPQHTDPAIQELFQDEYPYPIYSNKVIKGWDKYLYFTKIQKMKRDIEINFELSKFRVVHAHSLFSDGGVAYELYKKYKIPYVVAVRDTDVNQYFKKAKHLKPYALKILKTASRVVFLSKAYRDSVIQKFVPSTLLSQIASKSAVIPNGISDFWLKNIHVNKPRFNLQKEEVNLIFVGQIIKRKNIESVIKASQKLTKDTQKRFNCLLVGEKKDLTYYRYLTGVGKFQHIEYCSSEKLIEYYRKADVFIMPSLTETFGLVYAEALSQGLPVIYTQGQGFDGQFEEGLVGYGVKPLDICDISSKVLSIIANYDSISSNCLVNANKFDWEKISNSYNSLYNQVVM